MERELKSFLREGIEDWMAWMAASLKLNRFYETQVRSFDGFLSKTHPEAKELTQAMVDCWCAPRPTESANSCRARVAPIRSLISYLRQRGKTVVELPAMPRESNLVRTPHGFTEDELRLFFAACDSMGGKLGGGMVKRLVSSAIFRLMYSTGIRPNEARGLRVADLMLDEMVISVRETKGHCQRYVALHPSMAEVMRGYCDRMSRIYPSREYLFVNELGRKISPTTLARDFRLVLSTTLICLEKVRLFCTEPQRVGNRAE